MGVREKILAQRRIGKGWGGVKQVLQQTSFYATMLILGFTAINAYSVVSAWLFDTFGLRLNFWFFAVAIVVALLCLATFEYKVSLPSFFNFWNDQFYRHGNKLRSDMERQTAMLMAICRKLGVKEGEIEDCLSELRDNGGPDSGRSG